MDYRPALRERSGSGEYTHQLAKALVARTKGRDPRQPFELTIFSSSWKDRLSLEDGLADVPAVDCRIPVQLLNWSWHKFGWPSAELITRREFDVTHSSHPLIFPTRRAATIVTIHDLDFMSHPERTTAEIRRDYPILAPAHARRADRIIVPSQFTAGEVRRRFDVPAERIVVCAPGAPDWKARAAPPPGGYALFLGTLEPRKNIGGLLDAYERLLATATAQVPELVLAGKATPEAQTWLDRLAHPPLQGHVRYVGYVEAAERRAVYERALLVVQPSFEEGFGLPVLEAMSVGVPVVAARRGALPEVLGDAGMLVDPDDIEGLAAAILAMSVDHARRADCADKGLRRAAAFRWEHTASGVLDAYRQAIDHHRCESA
jgi:alpha-1,3-rhamnosyl/mannosyltransferase